MQKSIHLIVRISESQANRLADTLIKEQKNKSEIMREALERYMDRASRKIELQNQKPLYKIPEKLPMQEKYISLEVEDVFPGGEFTIEEVKFVEHFVGKLGINLESEVKIKYFLSPKQLICLLTGVKREYDGYLGLEGKIEE